MATLTLPKNSRYKDTKIYTVSNTGTVVFGLFRRPVGLNPAIRRSDEFSYMVEVQDIGQLDRIAVLYYGEGSESLWWVIALYNGIINPLAEMKVGQVLRIPSQVAVASFVGRGPIRT